MKILDMIAAFKLAQSLDVGYDLRDVELDEFEDLYEDVLETLYEVLTPMKIDSLEPSGNDSNVSFMLPCAGLVKVFGEFDYDIERKVYSYEAQDDDGKTYLVEWNAER